MADLKALSTTKKSKNGALMVINDPSTKKPFTHLKNKKLVEMSIKLLGPESPEMRRSMVDVNARMVYARENPDEVKTPEEVDAEAAKDCQMLADLTVGGDVFFNGKWIKPTAENAYDIYFDLLPVRSQALQFIMDLGNYTAG